MNTKKNIFLSQIPAILIVALALMGTMESVQAGGASTYTGDFYGQLHTNSGYTGTLTNVKVLFYDPTGALLEACVPSGTVQATNGVVDFKCDVAQFDMTATDVVELDSSQLYETYYAANPSSTSMALHTVQGNKVGSYSNDFGNGPAW